MRTNQQQTPLASQVGAVCAKPTMYKVCTACGSISRLKTSICPMCKSYRWETNPVRVAARAVEIQRIRQEAETE